MDLLEFVASVTGSLAWPVTIVGLAWIFRAQVGQLIGRISRAKAGPVELWAEVRDKLVSEVVEEVAADPTPAEGTGQAHDATVRTSSGQAGGAIHREAQDSVGQTDRADAVVTRGGRFTSEAVIAAMNRAETPEELAERIVDYVGLRTVPGLRGLSAERIRREQDLFGAILELQTLRARFAKPKDPTRLAVALDRIEVFWRRPEQLSDEEVENTTAVVRAVISDMAGGDHE